METVRCSDLGDDAVAAAERFRTSYVPQVIARLKRGEDIAVVLLHASPDHADWRRATVRDLARAYAPARVNFTTASDVAREDRMLAYLAAAAGVTGQYLPLHHD